MLYYMLSMQDFAMLYGCTGKWSQTMMQDYTGKWMMYSLMSTHLTAQEYQRPALVRYNLHLD